MNNEEKNTYVRQQITRTLIQLLEEKDISDISIKELCDTAMIGRASFYRNYSSKDNVIATYAHELISNWGEALEKNPEANILNFFEHLFNHFAENRTFYLSLHKQGLSSILLDTIKNWQSASFPFLFINRVYALFFEIFNQFFLYDTIFPVDLEGGAVRIFIHFIHGINRDMK